ncbi:hypothetical protein CRUP_017750 [Coryphaenoides rupestris]|nr:hypothetical protein CRUP_017750 [Coryphaenoides rupestris]
MNVHARELETRRRDAEEEERNRQKEVQKELERQLKEAQMMRDSMQVEMEQKEHEAHQQRRRIEELELTQTRLEVALQEEIQEQQRAQKEIEEVPKGVEEEEKKEKEEKENKKKEEEEKEEREKEQSPTTALDCASQELQDLRASRKQSHQHLEANRAEHRIATKQNLCPKKEGALASTEFISKYKARDTGPEAEKQALASEGSDTAQDKPNGQS